jgi:hypothetical protein
MLAILKAIAGAKAMKNFTNCRNCKKLIPETTFYMVIMEKCCSNECRKIVDCWGES